MWLLCKKFHVIALFCVILTTVFTTAFSDGFADCYLVNITRGNQLYETCYTFHPDAVNATDAANNCTSQGHGLVQDNTVQVHNILTSWLIGRNESGDSIWSEVWLGAQQTGWIWADGVDASRDPNWAEGQPAGGPLDPAKCALISKQNNFTFENKQCSFQAQSLCEFLPTDGCNDLNNQEVFSYNNSCFLITADKESFLDSLNTCEFFEGSLAMVREPELQQLVRAKLQQISLVDSAFWVGLSRSQWRWVSGLNSGETVGNLNYWNSTPSFDGNSCSILKEGFSDFWWQKRQCAESHPFICQNVVRMFNISGTTTQTMSTTKTPTTRHFSHVQSTVVLSTPKTSVTVIDSSSTTITKTSSLATPTNMLISTTEPTASSTKLQMSTTEPITLTKLQTSTNGPVTSSTKLQISTTEPNTSTKLRTSTNGPVTSSTKLQMSTTEPITLTKLQTLTNEPVTSSTKLQISTTEPNTSTKLRTSKNEPVTSSTKLQMSTTEPITSTKLQKSTSEMTTTGSLDTPTISSLAPTFKSTSANIKSTSAPDSPQNITTTQATSGLPQETSSAPEDKTSFSATQAKTSRKSTASLSSLTQSLPSTVRTTSSVPITSPTFASGSASTSKSQTTSNRQSTSKSASETTTSNPSTNVPTSSQTSTSTSAYQTKVTTVKSAISASTRSELTSASMVETSALRASTNIMSTPASKDINTQPSPTSQKKGTTPPPSTPILSSPKATTQPPPMSRSSSSHLETTDASGITGASVFTSGVSYETRLILVAVFVSIGIFIFLLVVCCRCCRDRIFLKRHKKMKNVTEFQMNGSEHIAAWNASNGFKTASDMENGSILIDRKPWHTSFGNPFYSPVSMDPQALDTASRTSSKKRVSFEDIPTEISREPEMYPEEMAAVETDIAVENEAVESNDILPTSQVIPPAPPPPPPPAPLSPPPSTPPPSPTEPQSPEGITSFMGVNNSMTTVPLRNADTQVDSLSLSNSMNSVKREDLSCTPQGRIIIQNDDLQQLGYY